MRSFSTMAVFMPSCAARIDGTGPPGPEPMTMQSYALSGIWRVSLADGLLPPTRSDLDPAHHPHELPEQETSAHDDRQAEEDRGHVGRHKQAEPGVGHADAQEGLEAEDRAVAALPHPHRGGEHERRKEQHAGGGWVAAPDVPAGQEQHDVAERDGGG